MRITIIYSNNGRAIKSSIHDTFKVAANTLYGRFLPKDSADLNILNADTTIELFDFPLDYEIIGEGFYYHYPTIARDKTTWLYTSVPIDYKFPRVSYQIIEECYVPDDEKDDMGLMGYSSDDFYGLLEL